MVLSVRNDVRLNLFLDHLKKRCRSAREFSGYDKRQIMWDIVCLVIVAD